MRQGERELGGTHPVLRGVSLEDLARRGRSSPEGAITIAFTDIEGSTRIVERLGDERWLALLHEHDAIVREHLAEHDGLEVKHQGDGFMLAFSSSRAALRFAIALQRALAEHGRRRPADALRVRIGVHSGFVIADADDYFGREVIVAARISSAAVGGEILVSGELRRYASVDPQFSFGPGRELELKGLAEPRTVHDLAWGGEG